MRTIVCECGNIINLSYKEGYQTISQSSKELDWSPIKYQHWTCSDCGQEYYEEIKKPIDLSNYRSNQ